MTPSNNSQFRPTETSTAPAQVSLALQHYRSNNLSAAVEVMQSVCESMHSWREADETTSSAYSWLATFSREALLVVGRGHDTTYEGFKKTFVHAVRNARQVADRFEREKPHAYREAAWETALFGSGYHGYETQRWLMCSLLRARSNEMRAEELATFKAWQSMSNDYELGIPAIPFEERERFSSLLSQETNFKATYRLTEESVEDNLDLLVMEIECALSNQAEPEPVLCPFESL